MRGKLPRGIRRGQLKQVERYKYHLIAAALVSGVVWYLLFISSFLSKSIANADAGQASSSTYGCVAWRQTRSCTPFGVRDVGGDAPCDRWISRNSGYCECANFLTVKRLECGTYTAFRCMDACNKLSEDLQEAMPLPSNVTCIAQGTQDMSFLGAAANWLQGSKNSRRHKTHVQIVAAKNMEDQAARLWWSIRAAVEVVEEQGVRIPEARTHRMDWVRDGVHMPLHDIEAARHQWRRFMDEAPPYPRDMFRDRGIVILAGGLTYMVPAWINIHMLRRTGCQLPVEMFFPHREYPTLALENALSDLGVTCRRLPDLRPQKTEGEKSDDQKPIADTEPSLSGFTMKIAALILSQFKEVVFLDSDNVAVENPASLFDAPEYVGSGALLWPDYWLSSVAPDLANILEVKELPKGTFESGQMVFNKERAWSGLLLAAFFNMQSEFYYEMFSNFMGKGDKESFAHALRASQVPYSVVNYPVGSVGESVTQCSSNGGCERVFLGNTMTQYSPDGKIMFLHTNLSPKWNLQVPGRFADYRRRWKEIVPGNIDFIGQFGDLEQDIYQMLVALRCSPFLPSYVKVLASEERMGEGHTLATGLYGFHPMNPGVEFRQAFRWGLSGPYLRFTKVTLRDRLTNLLNNSLKPRAFYLGRMFYRPIGWFNGRPAYFKLW